MPRPDQVADPPPPLSLPAFANEPVLDLRRAPARESLTEALHDLEARLPIRVPVWIGDERTPGSGFESVDPGAPTRVVAEARRATPADVDAAVTAVEAGTYGRCESCCSPIAPERLAVRPTARTCITCAA